MDMDKPNLYPHGHAFSEILATNLKDIVKRVDNKKASMILIDGGVGEGKTTLVIEIVDYINKINGHPEMLIENEKGDAGTQLAMGGVEFLKKLRICFDQKLPCVSYDEAGDFSKRGSLTKFNAMLNRTFETFRAFKCVVIISLPCFDVLDGQLFDNQIPRCLIHLNNRSSKQGNFDVYGLDEMNWIRYWMTKWPKHKAKAYGKVIPNYRGHFLDISPARSKKLDLVSTKTKLNILRKSEIKIEGLLSYPEIAQKVDRSVVWVRKAIADLSIKHKRVVDRSKYFEPDVVNQLCELLDDTAPIGRPKIR